MDQSEVPDIDAELFSYCGYWLMSYRLDKCSNMLSKSRKHSN